MRHTTIYIMQFGDSIKVNAPDSDGYWVPLRYETVEAALRDWPDAKLVGNCPVTDDRFGDDCILPLHHASSACKFRSEALAEPDEAREVQPWRADVERLKRERAQMGKKR